MASPVLNTGWADIVSASIRGPNHIASGQCCQDALSVKEGCIRGEPYLVCGFLFILAEFA